MQSSFDTGLFLTFPTFSTKAIIGEHDIYLDPSLGHNVDLSYLQSPLASSLSSASICRALTQVDNNPNIKPTKQDHLLNQLCQYYKDIKTKRQLNLEVPVGFCQNNQLQRNVKEFMVSLPSKVDSDLEISDDIFLPLLDQNVVSDTIDISEPSPLSDSSSPSQVPIIRCVDEPCSSLFSRLTLNEDFIWASVGFRRIDSIKTHLSTLYHDTNKLDSSPSDAVLDHGDMATIRKTPRNTNPVPRPISFGDVIHMDSVFGPEVALANTHYGLLFTDRFSRMTYIYPLQNLTSDIIKQLDCFFAHLGFLPKRLISDFDTKLIGGKAREHLNGLRIHINAAPAFHQDRNGLAKRHWQTLTAMARNWLASAELPAKIWFFAVKRASEICNYFPLKLENGT